LERYHDDEIGLVKKRHEQKGVRTWDRRCIARMRYKFLDELDEELGTFLMDCLLKQWKHAQRYWEICHSLEFFFDEVVYSSIWHGRELDIIEALASAFVQIQKAESCNLFNHLYVLALITYLPS
jgi:hypothetical protein